MGAVRLAAGDGAGSRSCRSPCSANPVVRCATLAGACCMGTLVGMTIFVPLYFEVVLHLSASQSGLALIPLMGATVVCSTMTGRLMAHMTHYKRMPLIGLVDRHSALGRRWRSGRPAMPFPLVLCCWRSLARVSAPCFRFRPCACKTRCRSSQIGVATGAANFFRALVSALVVAVLGAIVLGGLGGGAGMSVEMLARAASGAELAFAFRFVFLACAMVMAFGLAFIIAMEQRPLKGPSPPSASATTPQAPATQIPAE